MGASRSLQSCTTKVWAVLYFIIKKNILKISDESIKKWLKKVKKNPQKAKTFVWEPIEGYNVEPRFLTGTVSKPKKVKIKRGTKSMSIQI
jgi:hypothetical protein